MGAVTIARDDEGVAADRRAEVSEVHTRILRLALGLEDSRSYWEHVDPKVPIGDRALMAFEQRWFGSKSLERVRFLIACFAHRYDAFPEALEVLRRWHSMDAATRKVVCHWHLQLSDPLYRAFTGEFLVGRRGDRGARVDRDIVLRWVKGTPSADRWSEATLVQFASKLLSAASEAGVVSVKRDPRVLLIPTVPDPALAYLMHLLRGIRFGGTLTDNPYLASVGLAGGLLDQRLRPLRGISFRRMAHLTELEWDAPSLAAWAEGLT